MYVCILKTVDCIEGFVLLDQNLIFFNAKFQFKIKLSNLLYCLP